MPEEKSTDGRTRNWSCIVYPESAPENWRDILDELSIPWCESPLHEFDTEPTGELKKPHWHVALNFSGKKSYQQIVSILQPLHCPIPKRIEDMTGAVRYWAHMDSPHKHQYNPEDIVGHCGFDVAKYLLPSLTQRRSWLDEMVDYCQSEDITDFADLYEYARREKHDSWFLALSESYTMVMTRYITSRRHRAEAKAKRGSHDF